MSEETPSIAAPEQNAIAETGSITARTSRGTIHCITIVGQIEGHMELPAQNKTTKYEHLIPQIAAVEQTDEIDGLLVLLNTVGGDVEAGLAIAELIAGMKKPTVSLVLGGGHSIGVPLAVAAKKSFIAVSAAMTIHPVRMNGTIIAVPQAFEYLAKIQERIVDFITSHSHITAERLQQLMRETGQLTADVGTVISGNQAAALGLIDAVGTLSDALEALYTMIGEHKMQKRDGKSPSLRLSFALYALFFPFRQLCQHDSAKHQHTAEDLSVGQRLTENKPACDNRDNRLQTHDKRCYRRIHALLTDNLQGIAHAGRHRTGIQDGLPCREDVREARLLEDQHTDAR